MLIGVHEMLTRPKSVLNFAFESIVEQTNIVESTVQGLTNHWRRCIVGKANLVLSWFNRKIFMSYIPLGLHNY